MNEIQLQYSPTVFKNGIATPSKAYLLFICCLSVTDNFATIALIATIPGVIGALEDLQFAVLSMVTWQGQRSSEVKCSKTSTPVPTKLRLCM